MVDRPKIRMTKSFTLNLIPYTFYLYEILPV